MTEAAPESIRKIQGKREKRRGQLKEKRWRETFVFLSFERV